ncbi:uncharacterized protein B0J16DRAFT_326330 [Fusarium flagelliforme]|uniref:uncharacterized protein n=1 Tax=Fusarium flagelliforme TaxID=2675880 RepID=UPI001E8E8D46|nr:uncharacterized protein B0J16DRAFT_326330 [Fusarium flagelliforme]KAH7196642.1 hypothetical protein B0J16DRAFT_326330 [Fusarium flagelliforme]
MVKCCTNWSDDQEQLEDSKRPERRPRRRRKTASLIIIYTGMYASLPCVVSLGAETLVTIYIDESICFFCCLLVVDNLIDDTAHFKERFNIQSTPINCYSNYLPAR